MAVTGPPLETRSFSYETFSATERPFAEVRREYQKRVDTLADWIERARHYAEAGQKAPGTFTPDLKLAALVPVVEGKLPLLVVAGVVLGLLRAGSANLNNRSLGLDTECDLAIEATGPRITEAIAGLRCRLLGEHLKHEGIVDSNPDEHGKVRPVRRFRLTREQFNSGTPS